ncbi:MAG: CHRD domain-containing protein [Vicinamibacterales bacterium]
MNRRAASAYFAIAFVVLFASVQAQGARQFRGRLSPVPLDVAMQSTIAGSASITATLTGNTLAITGSFKDLKTPATVVRLHRSERTGMRGAAIGDLKATAGTSGTITGSIELTPDQITDLTNGRLYVQLHSEKAPDGNLWGWLFPQEGKK